MVRRHSVFSEVLVCSLSWYQSGSIIIVTFPRQYLLHMIAPHMRGPTEFEKHRANGFSTVIRGWRIVFGKYNPTVKTK